MKFPSIKMAKTVGGTDWVGKNQDFFKNRIMCEMPVGPVSGNVR